MDPAAKGLALAAMTLALAGERPHEDARGGGVDAIALQPITTTSASASMPIDEVLRTRRSVREFTARPVSMEHVARLCWAAQGVTDPMSGHRAAPSAGALYPLELYVVAPSGVFRYEPQPHRLVRVAAADRRADLARAAFAQDAVRRANVDVVLTAAFARTRTKYGSRAERFATLEAGHAAQNVLLEATALGLGAVPVGAFDDRELAAAIGASNEESPLYVLAIGHRE